MNSILDLMRSHSSVRDYEPETVDPTALREAVAAAQMAATSSHIQAYCVLRVTDPDRRKKLVELTGNQAWVATAGAFLVICGDVRRHRLVAEHAGVENVQNLETFILATVDASLFAQSLVLALESMGLGICYIGGLRNRLPEVDRLLELPEGVWPLYGLCVGKPATKPAVKPRLPVDAVLVHDRYPDDERVLDLIDEHDREMGAYYEGRGLAGRTWSGGIQRRFTTPHRAHLAAYYRAKGAVLE